MIKSQSSLPAGWRLSTLGEECEWGSGGTPKSTITEYYDGDIPWAIIGDLNDGIVRSTRRNITQSGLQNSSAKLVEPGSILIAMYGSIGKLGIAGTQLTTNQAIAFTKSVSTNPKYLFWYLMSIRNDLISMGKGGTQSNISQTVLKAVPFPIAPPEEQQAIVDEIETQFARLDDAEAALRRVQVRLENFRKSTLEATIQLVRECYAEESVETTLGDASTLVRNGLSTRPDDGGDTPILRISAVRPLSLDWSQVRGLDTPLDDVVRYVLEKGDLLFTRYNGNPGLVGACAVVDSPPEPTVHPDKLIRVKLRDADPLFVALQVSIGRSRTYIQSKVKTTAGQAGISGRDLKGTPLLLPELGTQIALRKHAMEQLDIAKRQTRTVSYTLRQINHLRQAILKNAFDLE